MWDPKKRDTSKYPKLDNFFYKQLLSSSDDLVLKRDLVGDSDLKAIVDKFAQDQKAYHDTFGTAFVKLSNLGQSDETLTHVENLLEDHPWRKFLNQYY